MGKIPFKLFKQFRILDPEWVVRAYFPGPSVQHPGVKSKDGLIQAPVAELSLSNQKAQFMLSALKILLSFLSVGPELIINQSKQYLAHSVLHFESTQLGLPV